MKKVTGDILCCALYSADSGMKEIKAYSRWGNVTRKYYYTQNGGF